MDRSALLMVVLGAVGCAAAAHAPTPVDPPARSRGAMAPAITDLRQVAFDWEAMTPAERTHLEPRGERLAKLVCGAIERLGPPKPTGYYDVLFQARGPDGAEVGLRVDAEYGDLEISR